MPHIMTHPPESVRASLPALLPDLRAFARFLARDAAMADDLVQEAVLRALRAETQWIPGTSLRAWVFHILRNVFLEQMRRRGTERRALERMPEPDGGGVPQEDHGELEDLGRALQSLPLPQREALILVGAHGLSHEEAAIICAVPVGTVKARVSRARATLARSFPHRASS